MRVQNSDLQYYLLLKIRSSSLTELVRESHKPQQWFNGRDFEAKKKGRKRLKIRNSSLTAGTLKRNKLQRGVRVSNGKERKKRNLGRGKRVIWIIPLFM